MATVPIEVLLVEDDEDDYVLTRDLLAEIGAANYALDWAPSYDEGLRRLMSARYDVCLLDYRLGAKSGLDLLRAAIRRGCRVPVILLTGRGNREVDIEAMHCGAVDYLLKDELNPALLERVVRYAVASKRHEEERLQLALAEAARMEAEAANRAKDEFLGMVSHELRGPLNAMLVWLAVHQEENAEPAPAAKSLAAIERNVRQLSRILDDLVDTTRIVHGTLRIEKRSVDLRPLIETAFSAVRPAVEAKRIALDLSSDPTLGPVAADPERLQQVLLNLLSNSIRFTPEAGRIEVRTERIEDGDGPKAQITVSDNGAGIGAALLPFVFDRYRQAPGFAEGRQSGLGLGLAIVRSLIELHGGSVRADSPGEGLGATFTVTLPLGEPSGEDRRDPAAGVDGAPTDKAVP